MKRNEILALIHKTLELVAPNTEYVLGSYDIFKYNYNSFNGKYVQIYTLNNKVIYVESNISIPHEISTLFKLRRLSDEECSKVHDTIKKYAVLRDNIGISYGRNTVIYEATPIYNLFNEIK
jgi:hypothetical protein